MASIQEKNLRELEYQSRETGEFHHEVSQEEYLIEKVKSGDESFLEDFSLEDDSIHAGHLSDDPVQRFRYQLCFLHQLRFLLQQLRCLSRHSLTEQLKLRVLLSVVMQYSFSYFLLK